MEHDNFLTDLQDAHKENKWDSVTLSHNLYLKKLKDHFLSWEKVRMTRSNNETPKTDLKLESLAKAINAGETQMNTISFLPPEIREIRIRKIAMSCDLAASEVVDIWSWWIDAGRKVQ